MPIDAVSNSGVISGNCTWNHKCGASATILIVGTSYQLSVDDPPEVISIKYNGINLTKAVSIQLSTPSGFTCAGIWYLVSPPVGVSYPISVFFRSGAWCGICGAVSLSGITRLDNFNTAFHAENSQAGLTASVVTGEPNCWVFGVCTNFNPVTSNKISRFNATWLGVLASDGSDNNGVSSAPGSQSITWSQSGFTMGMVAAIASFTTAQPGIGNSVTIPKGRI